MKTEYSLRWRVTLLMLILVGVSSLANGLVIYIANHQLEHTLLDTRVAQEMENFIRRKRVNDDAGPIQTADLRIYSRSHARKTPIPASLSAIAPGYYHDIKLDGRYYHLGVRDIGGDRIYVALDVTRVEQKEDRLNAFILAGALLTPMAALWIGFWLSRRVIAPVSSLAATLATLDPTRRNVRLAPAYRGYEVELIARAFDRYMERLDGFVERERDFTTAASHELRSPLAVIATSAELLEHDQRIPEPLREVVKRIQRGAHNMSETTEALLFLARESVSPEPVPASRTELHLKLAQIVDDHRHLLEGRSINLKLARAEPLCVDAPESHLSIIIGNLLRNAITHTDAGAVIVELRDRRLTIADTGAGIPPNELACVFERHYRGVNSRGSGLGLFIAQRVCARYGWSLSLKSQPGIGTQATVEF